MRIRRGDTVVALCGKNAVAGKTGKVLKIMPEKGRALVEGFNLVKKAMRKTQDNPQGGISEKEMSMPLSKLSLFCPNCKKGVRTGWKTEGDRKIRKCRKCSHPFDA
ncbi:MAG: 50S ribosomal protein L24 [bacterium]